VVTVNTLLPERQPSRVAVVCLALLAALVRVRAGDAATSAWAKIEKYGAYPFITDQLALYHNQSNEFIQSFSLNGVYQGQYWGVNADQGNASGWENRRIYLGGGAEFFHQFSAQALVKIGETFDPVYDGLHTASLSWRPNQSISLSLGRLDYFSFAGPEKSVAGTRISTFERGLVVNQVMPSEIVGALLEGKQGRFSGHAGIVSGTTTDSFTDFAGGFGLLAGVNYDLPLFFERGSLNLDYVFNNGNQSNNALKPFDHVATLWYEAKAGPFGLGLQLIGGHGLDRRPAVFGLTAMSTWLFAEDVLRKGDAFQAVLRYQFDVSDGDNGLELQQRYEQEVVPGGYGDRYQAVYAGINYLIYGQRLKLMNGVEYSVMHDSANDGGAFNGWTFLTGVRLYF
jgi:phosphate-selective porin OprO and OprP